MTLYLSDHARKNILERFTATDADAFAADQFGRALYDGSTHSGREVWRTPDSILIVARHPDHVEVVTAMPGAWPVYRPGEPYENLYDLAPAAPGALQRLVQTLGPPAPRNAEAAPDRAATTTTSRMSKVARHLPGYKRVG